MKRWAAGFSMGALAPVVLVVAAQAAAGDVEGVTFTATVDERSIDDADANDPLRLEPDHEPVVRLEVTNASEDDLFVRSVRLDSKVAGLTFFTFTTRIDLDLPAGEDGEREFVIDLGDLGSQATGLLPARLSLLDQDRDVLASEAFPVDVRGSLRSVYGLFGIVVGLITAVLLAAALVRLAAGRLPANRWGRAGRFATPGIGIGLTLTFTLSVLRVLLPSAAVWLTMILIGGVVGMVIGYLTPAPGDGELDEDDDELFVTEDDDVGVPPGEPRPVDSAGNTLPGGEPPRLR